MCVNLLPYREAQSQERKRQFFISAGISFAVGVAIVVVGYLLNSLALENQQTTNQYLETEISATEKALEEIRKIRADSEKLLGRKTAIETLQKDRSHTVHLFNELVDKIPESIYLTSLKQQGRDITVSGVTQSQARVSELMRNISSSPWIGNPILNEIKSDLRGGRKFFVFSLKFSMEDNPEAASSAAAAADDGTAQENPGYKTDNTEEAGQ
ncbi:MAG: PilN domain-containing protein [Betaproteobacteria bacterium]|nr:PilN domain-containing protein [Betaproteobacteria bacterium]